MNLSIRLRLAIWYSIVLALVLIGFGITAFNAAWRDQLSRVDAELSVHIDLALKSGIEPEDNRPFKTGPPSANDPHVAGIRTSIGETLLRLQSAIALRAAPTKLFSSTPTARSLLVPKTLPSPLRLLPWSAMPAQFQASFPTPSPPPDGAPAMAGAKLTAPCPSATPL